MLANTFFLLIAVAAVIGAHVGFAIGSRRKNWLLSADYPRNRAIGAWSPDYAVSAFQIDGH